jgi:hypothetical protein
LARSGAFIGARLTIGVWLEHSESGPESSDAHRQGLILKQSVSEQWYEKEYGYQLEIQRPGTCDRYGSIKIFAASTAFLPFVSATCWES